MSGRLGWCSGGIRLSDLYVGPTRTVVMERTVDKAPALPKDICDGTEEAIRKLHDAQSDFGYLRAPNTMFSGNISRRLRLGREGDKAISPLYLSRRVKWSREARVGDEFVPNQLFPE